MDLEELFNQSPLVDLLGIEIAEAADGRATGRLSFSDDLLSHPTGEVAHGAATYALADTVGGAAVVSLSLAVSPTVDMRVDYLAPVRSDLEAAGEVVRHGSHLSMVRVEIHDAEDTHVATAHGTYKTGGQGEETPWVDQAAVPD